ncbi:hypothetical protein JUJ52_03835 [Virgibacillus sp. AGTR]|uniref:hypothetical protein n=1 Tax=Virgibacillus sp. AGTR TaxID=2812055 RepID=UPI001D160405|nr:hypothetical protein [Virgibacillus sp. AGTR]MCC2249090.1 hypothetical protein [Virgibacillus sp. AGTR]
MENKEGTRRPVEGNGPRIGDTPSTLNEEKIQFVTKEEHQSIHAGVDWATGKDKTSLLVIELENETAVPKVVYKGEEINGKENVHLNWETKTQEGLSGGMELKLDHYISGKSAPAKETIHLQTGKYVLDD